MTSFGILLFHFHEIAIELIEAALPQLALPAKPVLCDLQSFRCKLVGPYPAGLVRAHQAALFEHFEVLDERWQGHVVGGRELTHRGRACTEAFQDVASCRGGQGTKNAAADRRWPCLSALRPVATRLRCHSIHLRNRLAFQALSGIAIHGEQHLGKFLSIFAGCYRNSVPTATPKKFKGRLKYKNAAWKKDRPAERAEFSAKRHLCVKRHARIAVIRLTPRRS